MNVITLKDYAYQHSVSYEAVRKQVKRYKKELEGHITIDGRQQFLDEEAVAFLDEKRKKNPVIIHQQSKDEEIEELKRDRERNLMKIAAQADQIAVLSAWKAEKSLQLAEAAHTQFLLDEAKKENEALRASYDEELERVKREAEMEKEALSEALKASQEALEKSEEENKRKDAAGLFGRIFKRW